MYISFPIVRKRIKFVYAFFQVGHVIYPPIVLCFLNSNRFEQCVQDRILHHRNATFALSAVELGGVVFNEGVPAGTVGPRSALFHFLQLESPSQALHIELWHRTQC